MSSGRDFLQVQINLLTGRVWLVPTVKTCTSEMVAANFVGSVFKDVGLQDCIVSDSDTRFVAELWTTLHETLGTRLVFGTPHHHHATAKVERVNGVLRKALSAFVNDRADNWDELIPLCSTTRRRSWDEATRHSSWIGVSILDGPWHCRVRLGLLRRQ